MPQTNSNPEKAKVDRAKLLRNTAPSEFVPDAFPKAQQATLSQTAPYYTGPEVRRGYLGLPDKALGVYRPSTNAIQVDHNADTGVVAHEAGHAIWMNDLTPEQKAVWTSLHNANPNLLSISSYKDDPSHSFANTYGLYASSPDYLKASAPAVYNFIRDTSGFEYSRTLGAQDWAASNEDLAAWVKRGKTEQQYK